MSEPAQPAGTAKPMAVTLTCGHCHRPIAPEDDNDPYCHCKSCGWFNLVEGGEVVDCLAPSQTYKLSDVYY